MWPHTNPTVLKRYGLQYKATYIGNWDQWNASPPWQSWTDFEASKEEIHQFHRGHPRKPHPHHHLTLFIPFI